MAGTAPDYPAEAPARLTRLDGLRGIAACVVAFAYHPRTLFAPELFTDLGARRKAGVQGLERQVGGAAELESAAAQTADSDHHHGAGQRRAT